MKTAEIAYVAATLSILKRPLADESPEMVNQIREAEGRVGYLYFILAQANADLDRAESVAADNFSKAEKLSAYVLEGKVNAAVSEIRKERDELAGLIKSLENRLMVGLGILKYRKSLPMAGD